MKNHPDFPAPEHQGKTLEMNLLGVYQAGVTFEEVVNWLQDAYAVLVHLEPGDGTRYTFVLSLIDGNLYAIRLRGYDVAGAACLPNHRVMPYEVAGLVNARSIYDDTADPSDHTSKVIYWFINTLLCALHEGWEGYLE